MRVKLVSLLGVFCVPFVAFASNEGVPSYYQNNSTTTVNRAAYNQYQQQGYTTYVGQSGSKQIVGSQSYSYQVPRQTLPQISGTMTTNGIALPEEDGTTVYAGYTRRFADFQFETGVNSILEWDDMVFNELVKRIDSDNYIYFSNGSITIDNDYIKEYIKKIMGNYNIEYFYLTKYDSNSLTTIINLDDDNIVFNDFLSYLNKNLDFAQEYNYIFASKTIDGRFAYLRVK